MFLKSLSIINFKNYPQIEIDFSEKINCFTGDNGVGKTNLLDAVYYLSFCKSIFNSIDSQNIRYNEKFFVIQGKYERGENEEDIYCGLKRGQKKQFKRNKKEYQKLSDHIGLIPLVIISPADSALILGGSEERRKFIDSVISQFDKKYLEDLIKYNRALAQRNKLLKHYAATRTFDNESLDIWDEQLIFIGTGIYEKRKDFINALTPVFQKFYNFIAEDKEWVELIYNSGLHDSDLRELLRKSREKDRIVQYTTEGIHKDDLLLKLEDRPIKKIGSQGQQKTYLLALKLAQFDFIKELNGNKPILLLDDVFDKLDSGRVSQLIKLVADNNFGQIFITDTSRDRMERIIKGTKIKYEVFNISDGAISE